MATADTSGRATYYGWLLLIFLAAAFLRFYALPDVPPGLTHDEADHGITAWSIVSEEVREVYFTIGYGREPLYDYATAVAMRLLGPTYLAGRLTAVFFSLITIAAMTAWVRRAFDRPTALLTAAALAVSFWPLMSARQSLRSVTLPALFALAVYFFWRGAQRLQTARTAGWPTSLAYFVAAGVLLGLTWYTYMPARGLWLLFVLMLGFWLLAAQPFLQRAWWRVGLMLLVMLAIAAPLLIYLANHPTAEVRIQELSAPLQAALAGDFGMLAGNVADSLQIFTFQGDGAWRYNIAGRPLLPPLMGLLFYAGLGVALWTLLRAGESAARRATGRAAASFLALAWLALGLAPVLITGPQLSMTQAIGMQPVVYLFPALALVALGRVHLGGRALATRRWAAWATALLLAGTAVATARAYFDTWANHPEVRVQYESTMVAAMAYLNEHGGGATAVSSITPDRYHSPALAQMTLRNPDVELRWFDARGSLLLPPGPSTLLIPGFTPPAPELARYFTGAEQVGTLPMRLTDLDRPVEIYALNGDAARGAWRTQFTMAPQPVAFGAAAYFLGYDLQTPKAAPGEAVRLVLLWEARQAVPDLMLFAHVLGPDGIPLAQADVLSVPSATWQRGDWFAQLYETDLPPETAVGRYPIAIGLYSRADGTRLPAVGQPDDALIIDTLTVTP